MKKLLGWVVGCVRNVRNKLLFLLDYLFVLSPGNFEIGMP
jgi:hypothetical protein